VELNPLSSETEIGGDMPYTVNLKTTRGSEPTDEIQRYKVAIAADVGRDRTKKGGTVLVDGKTYKYTVERVDQDNQIVYATVDNKLR
jgi:hypothetical protein